MKYQPYQIFAKDVHEAFDKLYTLALQGLRMATEPCGIVIYIPKTPKNKVYCFWVYNRSGFLWLYNNPAVIEFYYMDGTPMEVQGGYYIYIDKETGKTYPCTPEFSPLRYRNVDLIRITLESRPEIPQKIVLSDIEKEILFALWLREPTGLRFLELQKVLEAKGIHITREMIQSLVNRLILIQDKNGRYHIDYEIPQVVEALREICREKGVPPPSDMEILGYIEKIKKLLGGKGEEYP